MRNEQRNYLNHYLAISDKIFFHVTLFPEIYIDYVSPSVETIFGVAPEECNEQQSRIFNAILEEDKNTLDQLMTPSMEPRKGVLRWDVPEKGIVWTIMQVVYIYDNDIAIAFEGCIEDITEQQRIKQLIEHAKREWEQTFDQAPDFIALLDLNGCITRVNRSMAARFGYEPSELIGMKCSDLVFPSSQSESPCNFTLMTELHDRQMKEMYIKRLGIYMLVSVTPFCDEQGEATKGIFIARDITERKLIEQEHVRANKLQSLGILASGIAHDVNNIFAMIMSSVSLAKVYSVAGDKIHGKMEKAEEAIKRGKKITDRLRSLVQPESAFRKSVKCSDIINELLRSQVNDTSITATVKLNCDTCLVNINEYQMKGAFSNIILNAVHAMPNGGLFTVEINSVTMKKNEIPSLKAGEYIKIDFIDTGSGIDSDNIDFVFDPYFTTKYKAQGLGLALTYSIVHNHNGHVNITSEKGTGSTVTIYLPASQNRKNRIIEMSRMNT